VADPTHQVDPGLLLDDVGCFVGCGVEVRLRRERDVAPGRVGGRADRRRRVGRRPADVGAHLGQIVRRAERGLDRRQVWQGLADTGHADRGRRPHPLRVWAEVTARLYPLDHRLGQRRRAEPPDALLDPLRGVRGRRGRADRRVVLRGAVGRFSVGPGRGEPVGHARRAQRLRPPPLARETVDRAASPRAPRAVIFVRPRRVIQAFVEATAASVEVAHRAPPSGRPGARRPQRRRASALGRFVPRVPPDRPSPALAGFRVISALDQGHVRGSPGVMGEVSGPPFAGCVPARFFSPQPPKSSFSRRSSLRPTHNAPQRRGLPTDLDRPLHLSMCARGPSPDHCAGTRQIAWAVPVLATVAPRAVHEHV
jgi:hypothetical protein